MKKKITYLIMAMVVALINVEAQTSCIDLNGYVNHKNTGGTGDYTLNAGGIEKAAQTYRYSGPGKITSVRMYGSYTSAPIGGVPLKVSIYKVDANGRPTTLVQTANTTWWWYNNIAGYIDVPFGSAVGMITYNFSVEVELRAVYPWGNSFNLRYTGNGEGAGQDLASLAGTSTGGNWSSAKNDFNLDGDFYLVPKMTNFITSNFTSNGTCIATGASVTFTNTTQMSRDSMFNTIGLSGYTGSEQYYKWNFGDGSSVSNAVSPVHTYATAGVYTVSLKSTLVGWNATCSDTKTMTVSVGLAVSTGTVSNATCNGAENGSVTAIGSGGALAYSYSLDGITYQSSSNYTGLVAGSYTLYIKDSLKCVNQTGFTITEPTAIEFAPVSTTNATCSHSDGGILVSAAGGTGAIQYKLNSGSYQSSGSFLNHPAGAYTITAKDANGCTATVLATINDAGGPSLSIVSTTNVSCNAGSDGSIVLNATGGSGVLQYSINGGGSFQANGTFANISADSYMVMVKDAAGCSQSTIIHITQPEPLVLNVSSTNTLCHGSANGQIHVTSASGGTGTFSYSVGGAVYQSSPNFTGLSAGTYSVYVKDVTGCTANTLVPVAQPTAITATASVTPAQCRGYYDGAIEITASGGVGNYYYSVYGSNYQATNIFPELPAGTYTIRVRDGNNCVYATSVAVTQPAAITASVNSTASTCGNSNGSILAIASGGSGSGYTYSIDNDNFNSSGSFTGLSTGTYYIIATDGAGCSNIFSTSIIDANGPSITGNSYTNVSCNGGNDGTITISTVSGGTGVLQYSMNGIIWQTGSSFTGLNAGAYIITVKDANGCTGTLLDTLSQPNPFTMNTVTQNITCYGDSSGSATIYASGGAGIFAYSIDNGNSYQSSNNFDALSAGTYTIIVRDAASCTASIAVTLTQSPHLIMFGGVLNVSCNGANDGSISLYSGGGIGSYNYSINGDSYQASNIFSGLSGGNYTAYVKDSLGCVSELPFVVSEPDLLTTSANVNNISCSGGNNGTIALSTNGGTRPYIYTWSNSASTEDIFNLSAGTYSVSVRDANGCLVTESYDVTQPANPLIVNGVVTDASTNSSSDGGVVISVTGGISPYSYSWSNGAATRDITDVNAGTYVVNVTDANECIASGIFTVGNITGISNVEAGNSEILLYPNPASDRAVIEVNGSVITNMKVLDINGKVMFESEPNVSKAGINTNAFASGVYFVQVLVNGNWGVKRMIVSK